MSESENRRQRVPRVYRLPTHFHLEGKEWFVEEEGAFQLQIGAGVLSNDGRFFRVKDVWLSFDHHGRHPEGMHVFMELAKIDPSLIEPQDLDYYEDMVER